MTDTANVETLTIGASGSVGSVTHGHNQFGPWTRPRIAPLDPNTPLQQQVRAHLATCVLAWNASLTQTQRSSWDRYALAVRLSGSTGRRNNAGGVAHYVRSNVPRLQAAELTLPRIDQAPTLQNLGPVSPLERIVLNFVDDTIHPFFAESDAWSTESGAAMLLCASPAVPATTNFHAAPYRYAGPLLGSDVTLSSPATIAIPFPAGVGERVFVRGRVTRADGRLSHTFRLPADPVAQVAPLFTHAVFSAPAPPAFRLTVYFDALLRQQAHVPGYWLFRYANRLHYPFAAQTDGDTILLDTFTGPLNPGVDFVRYQPVTPDVFGLLTGIAVAAFASSF